MRCGMQKHCQFKKADGSNCRANPIASSGFCFFHDPHLAANRSRAQRKGGLSNKGVSLPVEAPDCDLISVEGVVKLLGATINQLRKGQLDPRIANGIGYLASALLRSFELSADLKARENGERIFADLAPSAIERPPHHRTETF